jgi:hypothetical protein
MLTILLIGGYENFQQGESLASLFRDLLVSRRLRPARPAVAEKFLIADSRSVGTSQTAGSPTVIFSSIPRVGSAVT